MTDKIPRFAFIFFLGCIFLDCRWLDCRWLDCRWFLPAASGLGQAKKSGQAKQESCDGALDVVPAKAMTFSRKRRQANQPVAITPVPTPTTTRKKSGK